MTGVIYMFIFFFFKQKTAYEMRISDWSSDVCSSDLRHCRRISHREARADPQFRRRRKPSDPAARTPRADRFGEPGRGQDLLRRQPCLEPRGRGRSRRAADRRRHRAAERARRAGAGGWPGPDGERKGVVEGKRGAVSVELGGSGILKKKK